MCRELSGSVAVNFRFRLKRIYERVNIRLEKGTILAENFKEGSVKSARRFG